MDLQSLILKVFSKSSEEELQQLKSWKDESQENLIAFQEIQKISDENKNLKHHRDFNTSLAYAKFKSETKTSIFPKILIGLLGLCLIAGIAYFAVNKTKTTISAPNLAIYQSDQSMVSFVLSDKSEIFLNNNSAMKELTDFSSERDVSLEGEAFFNIARDESKPFKIFLNKTDFIEVLGTSFNVINKENEIDVYVFSGKVGFHAQNRTIELNKGDRLSRIDGSYVKYRKEDPNLISWKNNKLVFKDCHLTDVIEDLSRHYNFKFSFDDNFSKSQCNLNTTFTNESLKDVLSELSKVVGLEYKQVEGSFVFLKCS